MTLERLVEEIRSRSEREAAELRAKTDAEIAALTKERNDRAARLEAEIRRITETEVARLRAQKVASAKLAARKATYEAREKRTKGRLEEVRGVLEKFADSDDYAGVVKKMVAAAGDRLGRPMKVRGRADDAALLKSAAGKSFDPEPLPILGGIVAETPDGSRRLNLSFDELLRLHEDEIRALLPP